MTENGCSGCYKSTKLVASFLLFIALGSLLSEASVITDLTAFLSLNRHPLPPAFPSSFEVSPVCLWAAIYQNGIAEAQRLILPQVAYNFTLPYERQYLPDGLT